MRHDNNSNTTNFFSVKYELNDEKRGSKIIWKKNLSKIYYLLGVIKEFYKNLERTSDQKGTTNICKMQARVSADYIELINSIC